MAKTYIQFKPIYNRSFDLTLLFEQSTVENQDVSNSRSQGKLKLSTLSRYLLRNSFKETSSHFEKYFLKRMMLKNQTKIYFSILLLLIDSTNYIITNLLDNDLRGYFWTSDALEIGIMVSMILLLALANASIMKENPSFSKTYLAMVLIFRFLSRQFSIISISLEIDNFLT